MLRDLLKRTLRKVFLGPRIPAEPPTGRRPPERFSPEVPFMPTPPEQPEEPEVDLDPRQFTAWQEQGRSLHLLDIREPHELSGGYPLGAQLIPMNEIPQRLQELPRNLPIVVVCAAGVRSYSVAIWLREQGFEEAWSLETGVGGLFSQGHPVGFRTMQAPFPVGSRVLLADGDAWVPATVEFAEQKEGQWWFRVRPSSGPKIGCLSDKLEISALRPVNRGAPAG
jgi:rhodanese-related sulfurtransferase